VEGTETRVNAQAEAYEYMVDFIDTNKVRYWWSLVVLSFKVKFLSPVKDNHF
jgi:hypothetical protein